MNDKTNTAVVDFDDEDTLPAGRTFNSFVVMTRREMAAICVMCAAASGVLVAAVAAVLR